VMFEAIYAKFSQNLELKELLYSTGDHLLVQLKPNDNYWGTGSDGKGLNKLAEIVMQVRSKLREEEKKSRFPGGGTN